ncbi:MAG: sugar ABC transporter permease, partial [Lentisphaeria bacterium]|nr:sugar ABC transporter permease [Lentisphaeria bacterium]
MSKKRNTMLFFLFISPWIIGFIMFSLGPIIASIYWSFTRYSIVEAPRWVGLDNFYVIFNGFEPNFFNSVRVTVLYSIFAVPGVIIVSLLAAMMLNIPKIKGMSLFRTIYFLPSLLPMVATAIVFAFLLDPKYGLITKFYETLWY